jgi:hypothetical protein
MKSSVEIAIRCTNFPLPSHPDGTNPFTRRRHFPLSYLSVPGVKIFRSGELHGKD